jgi:cold shock CspA family protein
MRLLDKIKAWFGGSRQPSAGASLPAGETRNGTITYFNWSKGYGFVECPGIEGRIFMHRTKLRGRVKVGDPITIELGQNNKGYFVQRVLSR